MGFYPKCDFFYFKWLGFFSRDIFEKCEDYSCAKQHMMKDEMVSPVYFILADGHSKVNL